MPCCHVSTLIEYHPAVQVEPASRGASPLQVCLGCGAVIRPDLGGQREAWLCRPWLQDRRRGGE
jgi:hypothetical protein